MNKPKKDLPNLSARVEPVFIKEMDELQKKYGMTRVKLLGSLIEYSFFEVREKGLPAFLVELDKRKAASKEAV